MTVVEYVIRRYDLILERLVEHIQISFSAVAVAIVIGLVVGYLITYNKIAAKAVLYICSVFMTIPSLALFTFMIPLLGTGQRPAIVGITIYMLLPVVRNVYVGFTNIDPAIIDSARGMGMTGMHISFKVKVPLALPVIFAGVRTSAVMGIGLTAIAAYIGAGGLGQLIFRGVGTGHMEMVIVGGGLTAILAVLVDKVMQVFQIGFEKRTS